jgi:hypothetical protein
VSGYDQEAGSGFHRLSIGHLVMGIAFLAIVGVWALVQTNAVADDDIRWLMPIPWVLAGVVGLAATAVTGSRRYAVRQTGWVGPEVEQPVQPDDRPDDRPDDQPDDQDADQDEDAETEPVARVARLTEQTDQTDRETSS